MGKGDGGANTEVGVGIGVFCDDETAVPDVVIFCPTSPWYGWPSSLGLNDSVEQKPSEDEIRRVRPSLDL